MSSALLIVYLAGAIGTGTTILTSKRHRIMALAAISGDSVLFPDEARPVLVPIDAKPKEQNVSS